MNDSGTARAQRRNARQLPEQLSQLSQSPSAVDDAGGANAHQDPQPPNVPIELIRVDRFACIGMLTAGVVHEINNPIGYVHTNLGVLRKYLGNISEYLEVCEIANSSNHRGQSRAELGDTRRRLDIDQIMQDLPDLIGESLAGVESVRRTTRNLRNFSRSDLQANWERNSLQEAMDAMIDIVSNELKYKVAIHRDYANMPPVLCVGSQIRQVFLKLLIDAGQAVIDHGEIRVTMGAGVDLAWIQIVDNGAPMPADTLRRVFDPPHISTAGGVSAGLGLWVSRGIIENHGGSISAESLSNGGGTRYRIELPIDGPATAAPMPVAVQQPHQRNGSGHNRA
jgi:two-component system, NtrC family, sensor kinase